MKVFKIVTTFSVIFLLVLFISGCADSGSGSGINTYILDGNWDLTTSNPTGGDIGSASFDQSFFIEFIVDIYVGSGTFTGGVINGSYTVGGADSGSFSPGSVSFSFSDGTDLNTDGDADTLDFDGIISGDTVIGTYSGSPAGAFAGYSGNFTATKQ